MYFYSKFILHIELLIVPIFHYVQSVSLPDWLASAIHGTNFLNLMTQRHVYIKGPVSIGSIICHLAFDRANLVVDPVFIKAELSLASIPQKVISP